MKTYLYFAEAADKEPSFIIETEDSDAGKELALSLLEAKFPIVDFPNRGFGEENV